LPVRYRAIEHTASISDETERRKRMLEIVLAEDPLVAVRAAETYIGLQGNKARAAEEVIDARSEWRQGAELANQAAVEYAFDKLMKLLPQGIVRAHNFVDEWNIQRLRERGGFPRGLNSKVRDYLTDRVDEVAGIHGDKRNEIL